MAKNLPLSPIQDQTESLNIEYKSCTDGKLPQDIWQTIAAFCNAEGGEILLGITPDRMAILLTAAQKDQLQQDMCSLCHSAFNYSFIPDVRLKGAGVTVTIPPAPAQMRPVYSLKRGVQKTYIRSGSSNMPINDEIRMRLAVAAKGGAESIIYKDHHYGDYLDLQAVKKYIDLINQKREQAYNLLSAEEVLLKLRAITKASDVTLFGLLAFGKSDSVQDLTAPTTNIAVTQYRGSSKVIDEDLSETYMDNREFNGNLLRQFYASFEYIKSKLPISGVVDHNGTRRDYLVIPEIALREALANSIAHRDYSTQASRVQVDIFADRLEIMNPGSSLVPIDELESAPSTTRNPLIMNFLKDYGITEQKARGIRTIKRSLKTAGLQEPRFENVGLSFKATLFSSAFISSDDQAWLSRYGGYRLHQRQLTALTHLKNARDGINNSEYRSINNMSGVGDDKRARRELNRLTALGFVQPKGDNKSRRYYLADMPFMIG